MGSLCAQLVNVGVKSINVLTRLYPFPLSFPESLAFTLLTGLPSSGYLWGLTQAETKPGCPPRLGWGEGVGLDPLLPPIHFSQPSPSPPGQAPRRWLSDLLCLDPSPLSVTCSEVALGTSLSPQGPAVLMEDRRPRSRNSVLPFHPQLLCF